MITLEDRLAAYRDVLDRTAADDTVAVAPTTNPSHTNGRGRVLLTAAAVVGLMVLVAAVATVRRSDAPPQDAPSAEATGAWTFDHVPADLELTFAAEERSPAATTTAQLVRLYAVPGTDPTSGPWLRLERLDLSMEPIRPSSAEAVRVGAVDGFTWSIGGVDHLVFRNGSYRYLLAARGIDDLVEVALRVIAASVDGGPAVDEAVLPDGVTALALGRLEENRFMSMATLSTMLVRTAWAAPDRRSGMFLVSFPEDEATFALHPIAADFTATATAVVHGADAHVLRDDHSLAVEWNRDGRTIVVGFYDYDAQPPLDDALRLVELLRPATVEEWTAMRAGTSLPKPDDTTPVETMQLPDTVSPIGEPTVGEQRATVNEDGSVTFTFWVDDRLVGRGIDVVVANGTISYVDRGQTLSATNLGSTAINIQEIDTSVSAGGLVARGVTVDVSGSAATTLTATGTDGRVYTTDILDVPGHEHQKFAVIFLPSGSLAAATVTDAQGTVLAAH